jgi:hypothetical protein
VTQPQARPQSELAALLETVRAARAAERSLHRQWTSAEAMTSAQRVTLRALEGYAAALDERGWPVPRSILQDLQLHRSLCKPTSSRGS